VPALARLHVQTFNETHRGGHGSGPSYELRERQWREAFAARDDTWFCFVVEADNGEFVGFAKGTPHIVNASAVFCYATWRGGSWSEA
jgi:hypothetical protein